MNGHLVKLIILLTICMVICINPGFDIKVNAQAVIESEREISIIDLVDVVVIGGSSAGVAAAVEAAQNGASVMLVAERPYLGDDITGTYRLWLQNDEKPQSLLAKAVFQESFSLPRGIPFTYKADQMSIGKHADTSALHKLTDGLAQQAGDNSVQYNNDVNIVIDFGEEVEFNRLDLFTFQRNRDFEVKQMTVYISNDQRNWEEIAFVKNDLLGKGNFEANGGVNLVAKYKAKSRYIKLEVKKAENAKRMLLSEVIIRNVDPSEAVIMNPPTMMQVKRVLEQALIDAGVRFVYSAYATDVLQDIAGNVSGVIIGNRAGRQAILGKIIVDATPRALVARMAGADFAPYPGGNQIFTRVVVGNEIEIKSDPQILNARILSTPLAASGGNNQAIEYTLSIPMEDGSHASFALAEQIARNITWDAYQADASEMLFQVPPDPIKAEKSYNGPWPGADQIGLDVFKPANISRLYVLNGCADISRQAAYDLLRPLEYMNMGQRIGSDAAAWAASIQLPKENELKLMTTKSSVDDQVYVDGDTKESLSGIRPFQTGLLTVLVSEQVLPVLGEYDVVVVGGGTSGAPAGIGAARQGAKTLVVEYLHGLGGMATLGQVSKYFGGYRHGFTMELDENSGMKGLYPWNTGAWNVETRMEWYRRELLAAGADIWFNTMGIGSFVEEGKVKGVVVATPQGRGLVLADVVIDSTGNSDIAIAAGAEYSYMDEEHVAMQGAAVVYRDLPPSNKYWFVNLDWMYVDETDLVDVWHCLVIGKERFADHYDLGQLLQTRERRRIVGDYTITPLDIINGKKYFDTIAFAESSFDSHGFYIHPVFLLNPPDHRQYRSNVPYRALLPKGLDGIIVTGLGISAHRDAMPALRMQPDVQNLGYASGVAAAISAKNGICTREINIQELQQHLVDIGNIPQSVLTMEESPPVNDDVLNYALNSFGLNLRNVSLVLAAEPERAIAKLREAYNNSHYSETAKLHFAQVLGVLADDSGVDTLIEAIRGFSKWDKGWEFQVYGVYGDSYSQLDRLIIALGSTGAKSGLSPILEKLQLLDANSEFSHYLAVAVALESINDPIAAKPLAELLSLPGMRGYAVTNLDEAKKLYFMGNITHTLRDRSLREIILAGALYKLGDHNGIGRAVLQKYAADLRSLYAQHANMILQEGGLD